MSQLNDRITQPESATDLLRPLSALRSPLAAEHLQGIVIERARQRSVVIHVARALLEGIVVSVAVLLALGVPRSGHPTVSSPALASFFADNKAQQSPAEASRPSVSSDGGALSRAIGLDRSVPDGKSPAASYEHPATSVPPTGQRASDLTKFQRPAPQVGVVDTQANVPIMRTMIDAKVISPSKPSASHVGEAAARSVIRSLDHQGEGDAAIWRGEAFGGRFSGDLRATLVGASIMKRIFSPLENPMGLIAPELGAMVLSGNGAHNPADTARSRTRGGSMIWSEDSRTIAAVAGASMIVGPVRVDAAAGPSFWFATSRSLDVTTAIVGPASTSRGIGGVATIGISYFVTERWQFGLHGIAEYQGRPRTGAAFGIEFSH